MVAARSGIVASLVLAGSKAAEEVSENAISAAIIPATPTRIAHVSVPCTYSTVSAALKCERCLELFMSGQSGMRRAGLHR